MRVRRCLTLGPCFTSPGYPLCVLAGGVYVVVVDDASQLTALIVYVCEYKQPSVMKNPRITTICTLWQEHPSVVVHKCLVKGMFKKTRHTVHCQTKSKAKFAKMYSLYTCDCGKEYSKCPNTTKHSDALQWLTFNSQSGHLGYRLTCYTCKADNDKARDAKVRLCMCMCVYVCMRMCMRMCVLMCMCMRMCIVGIYCE